MALEVAETILILAANPADQPQLSLDLEVREIENVLRSSRKHFEVKYHRAARRQDLRGALLHHRPSYVHFCGHGTGRDGIVLEGRLVDADALAGLFALFAPSIKCVVLNACYSTIQAHAIAKHIDFVVGMDRSIGDAAAIEFASAFYQGLGAGQPVEFAFALGRNAIQLASIPEHLTPQLLTRQAQQQTSRCDWDGAPSPSLLLGRDTAADILRSWILDESCRVVLITGLGGIGKTNLATCIGRGGNQSAATSDTLATGIHGQFECAVWRSLLNAPSPVDLFTDVLDFLSEHQYAAGNSPSRVIDGILSYLERRRCFVILDNVEAVLKPGDPTMGYRDGYELYGTFFERVASSSHQSCLLLTSRETPRAIADLEGERRPVRSLALTGIGVGEGQRLFAQIGRFSGKDAQWDQVVKLYQGNPLALDLAARHIKQVFGGDLTTFLDAGRSIFADLEELLDWHLNRLTKAETAIVDWLAVERGPVSLLTLQEDLVSPAMRHSVASTLQSLQRRIPLERVGRDLFTLQPVLIEHVTARLVERVASALTRALLESSRSADVASLDGRKDWMSASTPHGLSPIDYQELVESLLDGFRSIDELKQLVRFGLGENLEEVAGGDNLRNVVFRLVEHTESRGTTTDLVFAAQKGRPQNPRLSSFAARRIWPSPAASTSSDEEQGADASALHLLNTYSLLKSSAREEVRESQRRLLLGPIAERVAGRDPREIVKMFTALIETWRNDASREPGYLAGNIIHLLAHLNVDLRGICFSRLPIWQACLHDVYLHDVDFSFAAFRHATFRHPFGTVFSLSYSPDGKSIAMGDENGEVRVFLAASGQLLLRCIGHSDGVRAVTFSPDGRTIASASFDNTIRIWSVDDGRCLDVLLGHEGWVYSIAFDTNCKKLASASEDGTCRLWDLRTGRSEILKTLDPGFLAAVAISPDGKLLAAAGSGGVVSLFPMSDLEHPILLAKHSSRIRALAFSPQGDLLASGGEDYEIHLWRPDDGAHLATFSGHSNNVLSLSFSAAGDLLASSSDDHTVRLWSTTRKECVGQLQVASARVWAVTCNPAGRSLATASEDSFVRLWDMDERHCMTALRGYSNRALALACSADSPQVLTANEDGIVRIWDTRDARVTLQLSGHAGRIWSVACSRDGRWAATVGEDQTVRVWDLRSGNGRHVLSGHKDWIRSVTFSPDSRMLASAGEDGRVFVWDVATGVRVALVEGTMRRAFCVTFCNDGTTLAVGGDSHEIHLFNARDGAQLGKLVGHRGWLSSLVSRESTLASCSEDGTVRLWDVTRSECTAVFDVGHKVWSGAFHGRGDFFLSGSEDGVLRSWALRNGARQVEARVQEGSIWSLAVSSDERTVAAVGDDGSVRLWDLPDLTPCTSPNVLRPARPYEGMNITGATGLTPAQQEALAALGAIAFPSF
jgi:WD40 repeat protein